MAMERLRLGVGGAEAEGVASHDRHVVGESKT